MTNLKTRSLSMLAVITALTFSTVVFIPVAIAAPMTITVNSVADGADALDEGDEFEVCETSTPGECTLRAAIETANAHPGVDTINFNIPGAGVHTITPQSAGVGITDQVHIDGYSQPGAVANTAVSPEPFNGTILIELDGVASAASNNGGIGFLPGSEGSSVRGLSVYNFGHIGSGGADGSNVGVFADDVIVAGNYLGVRADGVTIGTGSNDASIIAGSLVPGDISNLVVGGALPADRNIVYSKSAHNMTAAFIGGSDGGAIYGNYFGIAKDGVTDLSPEPADTGGFQGPYTLAI